MDRNKQAEKQAARVEYSAALRKIAACATPGTSENKAYHAKLDAIHALAISIRNKREGR